MWVQKLDWCRRANLSYNYLPMSKPRVNLTGLRFGKLIALEWKRPTGKDRHYIWRCLCDCGAIAWVRVNHLRGDRIISCGCFNRELQRKLHTTHGKRKTPEYGVWFGMINRCRNHPCYGGRGIKVCKRWLGRSGFQNFLDDMGFRPSSKCSIDRKNNDGDYEPRNCRWTSAKEQCRNRRTNRILIFLGQRKTLAQWAEDLGFKQSTLLSRLNLYGWTVKKTLTTRPMSSSESGKLGCDIRYGRK